MSKTPTLPLHLDKNYTLFFANLKKRLSETQLKTAVLVNKEVIQFYWQLGKDILTLQANHRWGSSFIEQLSKDIQTSNPGMSGFSTTSLKYMRIFANLYPDGISQQPVDQLPWGQLTLLLTIKDEKKRQWYTQKCVEYAWSRSTLSMHMKSDLYKRQALEKNKASNYRDRLPSPQSDLAHEILKNPYNFDFLTISDDAKEREIEKCLTQHIKEFLLELGAGFAFVGTQVPIEVDDEQFFIDILFYHFKLRAFVVIELKSKRFKPADLGQLSFYLAAVDSHLRQPGDNPTIGILLCESRSKIIAEYALRKIDAPIGVSEYTLSKALPKELKINLPTIEEIEHELNEEKPNA